jgi:hypothetical protein
MKLQLLYFYSQKDVDNSRISSILDLNKVSPFRRIIYLVFMQTDVPVALSLPSPSVLFFSFEVGGFTYYLK